MSGMCFVMCATISRHTIMHAHQRSCDSTWQDVRLDESSPMGGIRSPELLAKFSTRADEIAALIWQQNIPGLQAQTLEWWMELLIINTVGAKNIRLFVEHCVALLPHEHNLWLR